MTLYPMAFAFLVCLYGAHYWGYCEGCDKATEMFKKELDKILKRHGGG